MRETLHADRGAPFRARRATERWADEVDLARCSDLVLIVSEFVANSVKHGPDGGRILLSLDVVDEGIRVEVRDEGRPQDIAQRPPRDDGPYAGGRGLMVIDALSRSWGVSPTPQLVWAIVGTEGSA